MAEGYDRKRFVSELKSCGLSQDDFARLVQLQPVTVYHWGRDRTPFPAWVPLLLHAMREAQVLRQAVAVLSRD